MLLFRPNINCSGFSVYGKANLEEKRALVAELLSAVVPNDALVVIGEVDYPKKHETVYAPNMCWNTPLYYLRGRITPSYWAELCLAHNFDKHPCFMCRSTKECIGAEPHPFYEFEKLHRVVKKHPQYIKDRVWHRLIELESKEALLATGIANWNTQKIMRYMKNTRCGNCILSDKSIRHITHYKGECNALNRCVEPIDANAAKETFSKDFTTEEQALLLAYTTSVETLTHHYYHENNKRFTASFTRKDNKTYVFVCTEYRTRSTTYELVLLDTIKDFIKMTLMEKLGKITALGKDRIEKLFLFVRALGYKSWNTPYSTEESFALGAFEIVHYSLPPIYENHLSDPGAACEATKKTYISYRAKQGGT